MNDFCGIVFHKNVFSYQKKWLDDFTESVNNQTIRMDILEIDYGGTYNKLFQQSLFYCKEFSNHADAHNFLCMEAVKKGYKYIFNHNVDDMYHQERVARQLPPMEEGFDVVSCNMTQMDAANRVIRDDILFSEMDILKQSYKGHNIIAHPACCYSKNFIENSGMLVSSEIPKDDYNLWKRSYGKFKFLIVPYTLLFYRIHDKNISGKR